MAVKMNMSGSTEKVMSDSRQSMLSMTITMPISVNRSEAVPTIAHVTNSCSAFTSEVMRAISTPTSARSKKLIDCRWNFSNRSRRTP